MCQILKMSYTNGNVSVEVSSTGDLSNCVFELYVYNFGTGEYPQKANIRQNIGIMHASQDGGIYRFKYEVKYNSRIRCAIVDGEKVLATKERYIGDRQKIRVSSEPSEIGHLYKIKADIDVSRKLIFYKSPASATKIILPEDLVAGQTLTFVTKEQNFKPRFETYPEFIECFNIEG